MNHHSAIDYSTGINHLQELTAYELSLVSGGMEQEGEPNQNAGGVSGLVYAIASGAVYGGVGSALTSLATGGNWAASGLGGMLAGGVVGGLKHITPP